MFRLTNVIPERIIFVSRGITVHSWYCSRTFLIYLFLRFAGVSYGRFIAVRVGFSLVTYIQNRRRGCTGTFKRRNGWERTADASSPVRIPSRTGVV